MSLDVLMQNLSVLGTAVLEFLDLGAIRPSLSLRYTWEWTTDRAGGARTISSDVGFRPMSRAVTPTMIRIAR